MRNETRQAIETLGADLRELAWRLYDGTVRCEALARTTHHNALVLCPLAMAVARTDSDEIDSLLGDDDYLVFHDDVEQTRRSVPEHIEDDNAEELDCLRIEDESLRLAAGPVIHEDAECAETVVVLGLDATTINEIVDAADKPASAGGRALIQQLGSDDNDLIADYEAEYEEFGPPGPAPTGDGEATGREPNG